MSAESDVSAVRRPTSAASDGEPLWRYGAALAAIAVLQPLYRIWAVQLITLLLVLSVPGLVLLRAIRVPSASVRSFPVLVPAASIVILLASALLIDLAGPVIGITDPITTGPLLVAFELTNFTVLLVAQIRARRDAPIQRRNEAFSLKLITPVLIPILAAVGAERLNSGHDGYIAALVLALCIVTLAFSFFYASWLGNEMLMVIVYCLGLAAMWAYSLRGALVYGFDIATEYQRLESTVSSGVWHTAHPGDAYGAMLSVTILPAELHSLTGLSPLMIFKLAFPALAALFPLTVFCLGHCIVTRRWAFAAAAFTLAQPTFGQELPGLARQEIALVMFTAILAVVFDVELTQGARAALVAFLGLSMVVSHYSTTYVAIVLFGGAVVLQLVTSLFRDVPRFTPSIVIAFVVCSVGAFIWYGLVTHSASALGDVAQAVQQQGLDVLPGRSSGKSFIAAYFDSNPPRLSAETYQKLVHSQYVLSDSSVTPLSDAGMARYSLSNSSPSVPAIRWYIGYAGFSLGSLLVQQALNLFGAVGALFMTMRRNVTPSVRRMGLFALSALLFLALIRVSGTLASFYNQERALLQALAVFAIASCWLMQHVIGTRGVKRQAVRLVVAASLFLFFVNTGGLSGVILGGGTAVNLANGGEDFERFYTTSPELAAARWLGSHIEPGQLVYADRYAQLPLVAVTGMSRDVKQDVTPLTINRHAWIYASTTNIVDGRARVLFENRPVIYTFPIGFLDSNFDAVYTDGSSEVFYR